MKKTIINHLRDFLTTLFGAPDVTKPRRFSARGFVLFATIALSFLSGIRLAPAQAIDPDPPPWNWLWIGPAGGTWLGSGPSEIFGNWRPTNTPGVFRPSTVNDYAYIDESLSDDGVNGTPVATLGTGENTSVGRLHIGATSSLTMMNDSSLRIRSQPHSTYPGFVGDGTIDLNGSIFLNSTGSSTSLSFEDGVVINGAGAITLGGFYANFILSPNNGDTFTIQPGAKINGGGTINPGPNGANLANIINKGLIDATHPSGIAIGLSNGFNAQLTNDGTLRASNGSTLRVLSFPGGATVNNPAGTIEALDNSVVRFGGLIIVEGGTVTSSGSGTIRGDAAGGGGGTLSNVTNTGMVALANGETLTLAGTFTNNGSVSMNSTGSGTPLYFTNGTTLAGTGAITMGGSFANFILSPSNGDTFTIQLGAKINGGGTINPGPNGANLANIINKGLIDATHPSGIAIGLSNGFNAQLTNDGTLRASNGSTLRVLSFPGGATVNNPAGTFEALDNSVVRVGGEIIVEGGTVTSSGSGTIRGDVAGNGGGTLSNVTNTGAVALANGETLRLAGTFTNNGSVSMNSTGSGTALRFANGTTLAGTGSVTMSNNGGNFLYATAHGDNVTLAAGATIQGAGNINQTFAPLINFFNYGLINATQPSGINFAVNNSVNAQLTNNGTLRASNGSTLSFYVANVGGVDGTINNGGLIEGLAGSTVSLASNVTLTSYNSPTQTLASGAYLASDGTLNLNIGPVVINEATVVLSGLNSIFTPINSLRQNDGTFVINNGRNFSVAPLPPAAPDGLPQTATANAFTNVETLILGLDSSLTVNGDYAQGSGSALEIVIGADYPSANYHHMNVTGNANLAGKLEVKLANGYTPAPNQTFEIIHAGAINGGFVEVVGATVTYTSTGVFINATGNTTALELAKAVSRKTHAGPRVLDINLPLTGEPGVESRNSAGNHTLVFTFNNNIVSGSASLSSGVGSVSGAPTFAGKTMTVNLTGVADVQTITVTLNNVMDVFSQVLPPTAISASMLLGDTNGDGRVNVGDTNDTRSKSGQIAGPGNSQNDVNLDGRINVGDTNFVRARSGNFIPPQDSITEQALGAR